jgi:hypothetical protein
VKLATLKLEYGPSSLAISIDAVTRQSKIWFQNFLIQFFASLVNGKRNMIKHLLILAHLNQLVGGVYVSPSLPDNNSCQLLYLSFGYTFGYGIKQIVIKFSVFNKHW